MSPSTTGSRDASKEVGENKLNMDKAIERSFSAASTFMSGIMAISATQILGAPLKRIDPKLYEAYMAFTKQSFGVLVTTLTQWWSPTVVRVSGDTSIPQQLFRRQDGSLQCKFPRRMILMANHQLYTDWLYVWWIAYTNDMHGYIFIILKESLKKIPIVGWGCRFYNFIFLSRKWEQDQYSFRTQLKKLSNPNDPMWLLIFPEGTNLSENTRQRSAKWADANGLEDMKHQLLPRSRGLRFCLENLKASTEWLYDCTIGYEGIPPGQYGQDLYTLQSSLFEGKPPKSVNMHFRRFRIASIPFDDEKAFDVWLRNRWREKDYLLEHFARFNSFPVDHSWLNDQIAKSIPQPRPARIIETQVKSKNLEEFMSIFAPLTSIIMVLSAVSGGGDANGMMKLIGDALQTNQTENTGRKLLPDATQFRPQAEFLTALRNPAPSLREKGPQDAPRSQVSKRRSSRRPQENSKILSKSSLQNTASAVSTRRPGSAGLDPRGTGHAAGTHRNILAWRQGVKRGGALKPLSSTTQSLPGSLPSTIVNAGRVPVSTAAGSLKNSRRASASLNTAVSTLPTIRVDASTLAKIRGGPGRKA